MRYKKGDRVVLNDNTLAMNEGDVVTVDSIEFRLQGLQVYVYQGDFEFLFNDDMIDHKATAVLQFKNSVCGADYKKYMDDNNMWKETSEAEGMSDEPLSLTIKVHGAKAYRDKLEELHRQIETVEHTIEQLNEMDMTIEVEEE